MRSATALRTSNKRPSLGGTPFTDAFVTLDDAVKWPVSFGSTYPTVVSGRIRIACAADYPQIGSAARFDLNVTPIWVQVPTIPAIGTGTRQIQFVITGTGGNAQFQIQWGSPSVFMFGTGITGTTNVTYSSSSHQWLRFSLNGGNLLFEASPDDINWSTLRGVPAPAWTNTLLSVQLNAGFYGTEVASFAEFDNFRL